MGGGENRFVTSSYHHCHDIPLEWKKGYSAGTLFNVKKSATAYKSNCKEMVNENSQLADHVDSGNTKGSKAGNSFRKGACMHQGINAVWSRPHNYSRHLKSAKNVEQSAYSFVIIHIARCELGNRADTICCANNFRHLAYTGQQYEVHCFHNSLNPLSDIPAACCATL